MRLQAGTLLHGDTYKIEKVLGQGSFGITYLAMHTVLERKVCIKEFFMKEINTRNVDGSITGMTDGSLSYNYGQKFKKEALNLSRLDHPNIVRVTDSFEENGTYYYVMDYIDGDNLNDYLKGHEVTQKEALDIIRDVATALMYMHEEKKMLHLDLKPGNIMRRHGDGHIFLIDFGLSKHYSSDGQPETSTSIGLGTAGYAPIEQANQMKSGEFRPTIDVYALGATLFKLLTSETPPQASEMVSDDELIESKLRANGITGPIIDVVVNAMMPNVRKRTQSVKAFLDSLPYGTEEKPAEPKPKAKKKPTAKPKAKPETVGSSKSEETEVLGEEPKETNIDTYNIPIEYVKYPTTTVEKANNGDVNAMFALGMMFLHGLGVMRSLEYALPWFQKAQALGDARAKNVIAQWDKLKKKYEKKSTKTNVDVVDDDSLSWLVYVVIVVAAIAGLFVLMFTIKGCETNKVQGVVASYNNGELKVKDVTYEMVSVAGGTFTMGATSEMEGPFDDEKPKHQVTVGGFSIGRTEVTQGLWKAVMGNRPSALRGDFRPVESVSWDDCMKFISKLNDLTGENFRLPTEAEWEFAARGGNNSKHTQYSGSSNIGDVSWYNGNSGRKHHYVAEKQANELGIYDMSGNVWEWCSDRYGNYGNTPQINPTGANCGAKRIIRGGGFLEPAGGCRLSNRSSLYSDESNLMTGLRLCLSE